MKQLKVIKMSLEKVLTAWLFLSVTENELKHMNQNTRKAVFLSSEKGEWAPLQRKTKGAAEFCFVQEKGFNSKWRKKC